ncbi:MAG: hypothetical protein HY000_01465 [Planctomycetes bacterium]|nr:hypothetical protein [Planctomycetota bacterium]
MAGAKRVGPDPRISARRAARLYRLLTTLDQSARNRTQLVKLGRAGMRTFYRDLTVLDDCKIEIRLKKGHYGLVTALDTALNRLPFPTPELTFGDVFELSKGRTAAHAKLRAQVQALTG